MSRGDGRLDLVVRLAEEDRRLGSSASSSQHRGDLASVATLPTPRVLRRSGASTSAGWSLSPPTSPALTCREARKVATMQSVELDGVNWEMAGQSREMDRSLSSLQMALGLAIFLVYVIMASTFESILHPFVILVSVPLAVVGVVAALAVFTTPVSVVVLIGSIVLAGVVVNNAIVLVDTINRLRADGRSRVDAIAEASSLRLRPILITTTTTVLGLLPLAFGFGEGAEVQQPLALTIIAGWVLPLLTLGALIPVVPGPDPPVGAPARVLWRRRRTAPRRGDPDPMAPYISVRRPSRC